MSKTFFLPTRDLIIFPGIVTPLYVGRLKSINTLEAAVSTKGKLVLGMQKDASKEEPDLSKDINNIGVVANILQIVKMPNNNIKVLVEAEDRVEIESATIEEDIYKAEYKVLKCTNGTTKEAEAIYRKVLGVFEKYVGITGKVSSELLVNLKGIKNVNSAMDIISANLPLKSDKKQELLEVLDVSERGIKILELLTTEMEIASLEKKIDDKVKAKMNEAQKNYFIKEKINAMKEELGDYSQDDDILELVEKVKKAKLPKDVKAKIDSEMKKLSKMPPFSAEATVSRNYIETIIELPWDKTTKDIVDLKKASEILERDHYGLKDAKNKVLDFLAVKKLNPNMKGSILCLAGPPGIGKTSLVRSIADAMGRKFVRVSLGGVRDEAEIRGHRRTYVGSIPGRIVNGLKEAQTKNPVFLLDEIDKMSSDYKGDPAAAMLEVLDPEQNKDFVDHYLEIPFDLSKILFVTTANSLSTIPRPLLDRMEIIEVSGYIEQEKLNIAKKYLLPKQIKEHALTEDFIKMDDEVIIDIINSYTREAGVRNLERTIAKICRKVAKKYVENPSLEDVVVTKADLDEYLGKNRYRHQLAGTKPEVGIVTGLAWTAVGGETLTTEVNVLKGKGQVVLTGKLGDVMKESAQTGISYIRSIADKFNIDPDFYTKNDIHIHLPEGAVPKDGPSAGITMALAVLSALTNIPVRNNVAMTGEITLRGRVLAVGGIKEKLLAAHRAGITKVLLPKECEADLEEIPQNVKEQMEFVLVEHMDEVLEHALLRNGEK